MPDDKKWWIESSFLHTCWTEDSPKNPVDFHPFYFDSILKCIKELNYSSVNRVCRPDRIPIGAVFGIRILLLTTIIIGERKLPAHTKLLETTTRSSLNTLQWSKMESILQNPWSNKQHVSSLKNLAHDFPTHKQLRNKGLRPSFEFSPILCCLNDVTILSVASVLAVQVIDRSSIFRALSHLWN